MQPISVYDYEKIAQAKMEQTAWDYYQGGSGDELTLRANSQAFTRLRLRPRVLVDVSTCDLRTNVQDTPVSMPVLIAPTAAHGLAHPFAECATAEAASKAGTVMIAGTDATRSLEEIAQSAPGPRWFQLYVYSYKEAQELVERAEAANYQAIVLTVDLPVMSRRERDMRNDFKRVQMERYPTAFSGNARHNLLSSKNPADTYIGNTLTWEILPWLRSITSLPILVKGILTREDALLAVEHGAAGIVVSNHGGRQLDGVLPTIEALPEVVEAVAGRCEVYMDGGIRRGTDILKALALGAQAVLIGRPILWGLAANGSEGVYDVLEILRAELALAMALSGTPTIAAITSALVRAI